MLEKLKNFDKKRILKIAGSILALFLLSLLIEYYGFGRHFNQYLFLFILAIASLISIFIALRKKIGEHPELGFLAVALICGSLLSFSEPKEFVSWDEQIHYKRVERLAANLVKNMPSRPNFVHYSYSIDEQKKINTLVDSQYKQPKNKSFADDFSYQKAAYIPSVIALALGNLIHLQPHVVFIFGRWINLLAYALIVYFAIRKLKSGKMIMSVVALFPTSVFLASNYSYDSWVTAFTMLGLAYLFSELQQPEQKITLKNAAIMIGSFVIGIGPKAIYFPLMLLMFLLPKSKFESLKQYKTFIIAISLSILFVAGSFILPFLISGTGSGGRRAGLDVDTPRQIHFIVSQPVAYTKILLNFTKNYINPLNASGFTNFFAYLGMTSGFFIILTIVAVITFTDKNEYDKKTATWKTKLSIPTVFLATIFLIATALYVSFTVVGSKTIDGVQPRYLIPLIFPLLFVLGSSRIKNPFNKSIYNTVIFGTMAFILLHGIWDLIIRNYH